MLKKNKILVLIASLLLFLVYAFPIWKIALEAPQYPEGLGLLIWVDKITGVNENDLQTLNGLNHYIGMKEIKPESIPELKIIPYVIGFFILSGLLIAFKGNEKWIIAWIFLFIVVGFVGIYDFYQWEYNYGHDLNSNAPIKVPGASYQPPLIGSKQLLNIKAISAPYIGSIIIFISIALAWIAQSSESKHKT